MPWSVPKTWIAGAVLPASDLNTHLRDQLLVLRAGGIAISSQAALDFIYAVDDDQFGRVAAVASRYPRANAGLTAWEMAIPTAGVQEFLLPYSYFRPLPVGGCGAAEDATSTNTIGGMPFGASATESCYCWVRFPKKWNEGTFTAQFGTFNKAGGSGDFVFSIAALAVSDDESISSALGTSQKVTDTILAAYDRQLSAATPAVTPAGTPVAGDDVLIVVSRLPLDGADSYGSPVYFHDVTLFLTTDAETDA